MRSWGKLRGAVGRRTGRMRHWCGARSLQEPTIQTSDVRDLRLSTSPGGTVLPRTGVLVGAAVWSHFAPSQEPRPCQSGDSTTNAFAVDFMMNMAHSSSSLPNVNVTFFTSTRSIRSIYMSTEHTVLVPTLYQAQSRQWAHEGASAEGLSCSGNQR